MVLTVQSIDSAENYALLTYMHLYALSFNYLCCSYFIKSFWFFYSVRKMFLYKSLCLHLVHSAAAWYGWESRCSYAFLEKFWYIAPIINKMAMENNYITVIKYTPGYKVQPQDTVYAVSSNSSAQTDHCLCFVRLNCTILLNGWVTAWAYSQYLLVK